MILPPKVSILCLKEFTGGPLQYSISCASSDVIRLHLSPSAYHQLSLSLKHGTLNTFQKIGTTLFSIDFDSMTSDAIKAINSKWVKKDFLIVDAFINWFFKNWKVKYVLYFVALERKASAAWQKVFASRVPLFRKIPNCCPHKTRSEMNLYFLPAMYPWLDEFIILDSHVPLVKWISNSCQPCNLVRLIYNYCQPCTPS